MRYEYFIHDAKTDKRLDGPYTSREATLRACVKFDKSGIKTNIVRHGVSAALKDNREGK